MNSTTVHKDLEQIIIITTADKLKLSFLKAKKRLKKKFELYTSLGFIISFITTLCTAEFKNILGLGKETWYALFLLCTILTALWSLVSLIALIRNKDEDDPDKVIEQLVNNDNGLLERDTIASS